MKKFKVTWHTLPTHPNPEMRDVPHMIDTIEATSKKEAEAKSREKWEIEDDSTFYLKGVEVVPEKKEEKADK